MHRVSVVRNLATILFVLLALLTVWPRAAAATTRTLELSADIWDWTSPAANLEKFEAWAQDLAGLGFTRLELSVPWRIVEPEPGHYDLTWLRDRAAICRKHGLGVRLRINSYFRRAVPDWYKGDFWTDANGKIITARIPSISDEEFWKYYAPLCTAIATEMRGQDVLYNAFIGTHAELKYGDWWTFDEASLALWRQSIAQPRPAWLSRVVGNDNDLPTTPTVPQPTSGTPDLSTASRAFIAFREWTWRRAAERFCTAIRKGDPDARISAPLGESFRRESALMSNLDYWGLTRGSQQVVHSYDFFLHPGQGPQWHAAASFAAFQGITGLPVVFEFDSPATMEKHGYSPEVQQRLAEIVLTAGAGLKFANFSYFERLPHEWPILKYAGELGQRPTSATLSVEENRRRDTVLLFLSKWANYSYREPTEWLHEAQFGWWKLLSDCNIPVRIICEDNLRENLSGYRALISAFSPPELMPKEDRLRLEGLPLPMIIEHATIPTLYSRESIRVNTPEGELTLLPVAAFPSLSLKDDGVASRAIVSRGPAGGRITLGFSVGYYYYHGESSQWRDFVRRSIAKVADGEL